MLRVSVQNDKNTTTLQIEGKVVGPWATELSHAWPRFWASGKHKKLQLDIRGVTFVDSKGTQILREIVRETGAELLADSPLTQYFANQAKCETAPEPIEEG